MFGRSFHLCANRSANCRARSVWYRKRRCAESGRNGSPPFAGQRARHVLTLENLRGSRRSGDCACRSRRRRLCFVARPQRGIFSWLLFAEELIEIVGGAKFGFELVGF